MADDEPSVADAYSLRLDREYDVRTAHGEHALEIVHDDVDGILLDRRMPDVSGDELLEAIRERGNGRGVVVVTAVDPDFDVVDTPFDDYLQKPVDREALFDAIEARAEALREQIHGDGAEDHDGDAPTGETRSETGGWTLRGRVRRAPRPTGPPPGIDRSVKRLPDGSVRTVEPRINNYVRLRY